MQKYLWAVALAVVTVFLNSLLDGYAMSSWFIFGFAAVASISMAFMGPEQRLERFIIMAVVSALIYGLIIGVAYTLLITSASGIAFFPRIATDYLELSFAYAFCFFIGSLAGHAIKGSISLARSKAINKNKNKNKNKK